MPIFRYEATDPAGKNLRGAMDAQTALEVRQRLISRGFTQVTIGGSNAAPPAAGPTLAPPPELRGTVPSARAEDLALFFRQLASLLGAGFTPGAALANLGPRTANEALKVALTQMAPTVSSGASLAEQLASASGLIPEHMVGLVAAGETGGFLPFACEEAALGAEQDAALRQGLGWVRFLVWQAVWSVLILQPFFPCIDAKHLENIRAQLLLYVRWLTLLCIPLGVAMHIACYFLGRWWSTPAAQSVRDGISLKVPVMNRLARMRALATFTRVLRKLLDAGISPLTAYEAAARGVPNRVLRERLLLSLPILRSAGGIDEAIQLSGLMDHDPIQLLVTGQQTGKLTEMLDQVTAYYQEEAAKATDAARRAQKQFAGIVTIVSMGYVTILTTYYGGKLMFAFTDSFSSDGQQ